MPIVKGVACEATSEEAFGFSNFTETLLEELKALLLQKPNQPQLNDNYHKTHLST